MVSPKASIKNSVKGRRLPSTLCLIQICIEYTKDKNVYWGKASILSTANMQSDQGQHWVLWLRKTVSGSGLWAKYLLTKTNTLPPTQEMLCGDCLGQACDKHTHKLSSLPCSRVLASEGKGRNPAGGLLGQEEEHRVEINLWVKWAEKKGVL